jgi:hypothetical protein
VISSRRQSSCKRLGVANGRDTATEGNVATLDDLKVMRLDQILNLTDEGMRWTVESSSSSLSALLYAFIKSDRAFLNLQLITNIPTNRMLGLSAS